MKTTRKPLQVQENAARFASRPDAAELAIRHAGVRDSLTHIHRGDRVAADLELVRSVKRQARIAGLGSIDVPCCVFHGLACPGHTRTYVIDVPAMIHAQAVGA